METHPLPSPWKERKKGDNSKGIIIKQLIYDEKEEDEILENLDKITSLNHEILDHPVELASLVTNR